LNVNSEADLRARIKAASLNLVFDSHFAKVQQHLLSRGLEKSQNKKQQLLPYFPLNANRVTSSYLEVKTKKERNQTIQSPPNHPIENNNHYQKNLESKELTNRFKNNYFGANLND
jgi:hypothetical protein